MKARVEVTFQDFGEAARYLAGYTSELYRQPLTAEAYRVEFPLTSYDSSLGSHIAEAAALTLYERFCTDRGRKAARDEVCNRKPKPECYTVTVTGERPYD